MAVPEMYWSKQASIRAQFRSNTIAFFGLFHTASYICPINQKGTSLSYSYRSDFQAQVLDHPPSRAQVQSYSLYFPLPSSEAVYPDSSARSGLILLEANGNQRTAFKCGESPSLHLPVASL
jgi:hypothetical protein